MDTIWQPDLLQKSTAKYRSLLDAIRAALENGTISKLNLGTCIKGIRTMLN